MLTLGGGAMAISADCEVPGIQLTTCGRTRSHLVRLWARYLLSATEPDYMMAVPWPRTRCAGVTAWKVGTMMAQDEVSVGAAPLQDQ